MTGEGEIDAEDAGPIIKPKVKVSAAELWVRKEIPEIDLPDHAKVSFPDPKNILEFKVNIDLRKEDCLWKGGIYDFTITIPKAYPYSAPKAHCDTPVYHPNIDLMGNVCLNILRADWKPVLDLNAVILGLIFLFIEPNPEDPLNHEAASLQRDNYKSFESNVWNSLKGNTIDGVAFPKFI